MNALIALVDLAHVHHRVTQEWFEREGAAAWATCPLTENGVLRIVGGARYVHPPGTPAAVAPILRHMRSHPGHRFWHDDISLLDSEIVDAARLLNSAQLTDTYLLALAQSKGGRLATLDRRLVTGAVQGGAAAMRLIG